LPKYLVALVWTAGPISGLLIQPIVGVLSDNCSSQYGRRRPFMVISSFFSIGAIIMIAYSEAIAYCLSGGYKNNNLAIFIAVTSFYILDFSINAVMASSRALIVDIAPMEQQHLTNAWAGRMVGIGNVIGYYAGTLDLPKIFSLNSDLNFPSANTDLRAQLRILSIACIIFFATTVTLTCYYTPETKKESNVAYLRKPLFEPFISFFKNMRNLPPNIQDIFRIQFMSWL
jgi:solute carrier family 45 protein 1/2/4